MQEILDLLKELWKAMVNAVKEGYKTFIKEVNAIKEDMKDK